MTFISQPKPQASIFSPLWLSFQCWCNFYSFLNVNQNGSRTLKLRKIRGKGMWKGYYRHHVHQTLLCLDNGVWGRGWGHVCNGPGEAWRASSRIWYPEEKGSRRPQLHKPHSKRSKRVREMTEKRGGNTWESLQSLYHTAHQGKADDKSVAARKNLRQEMWQEQVTCTLTTLHACLESIPNL